MAVVNSVRDLGAALSTNGNTAASPLASSLRGEAAGGIGAVADASFSSQRRFENVNTEPFNVPPDFVELGIARRAGTSALSVNESLRAELEDIRRAVDDAAAESDNEAVEGDARVRINQALSNIESGINSAESPDGVNLLNGSRPEGFRVTLRNVPAGDVTQQRPSQDSVTVVAEDLAAELSGLRAQLEGLSFSSSTARADANNALAAFSAVVDQNRVSLDTSLRQVSAAETQRLAPTDDQRAVLSGLSLDQQISTDADNLRQLLSQANGSSLISLALVTSPQADPRASTAGRAATQTSAN